MIWTLLPSGSLEVAGPRAVAVRAGLRVDRRRPRLSRNAAHAIDVVGRADDQPQVIERPRARRPGRGRRRRAARCRARLSMPDDR